VAGVVVVLVAFVASVALLLTSLGIHFWGLPTTKSLTLLISFGMAIGTTGIILALMMARRRFRPHREGYVPAPFHHASSEIGSQRIPFEALFGTIQWPTYTARI